MKMACPPGRRWTVPLPTGRGCATGPPTCGCCGRRAGRVQLLLQKRSLEKDSYPGCYDISSAGHIPAGVDFIPSALRELKEELGLEAKPQELILCGVRRFEYRDTFHGHPFHDNQVSRVYALWRDVAPGGFDAAKRRSV